MARIIVYHDLPIGEEIRETVSGQEVVDVETANDVTVELPNADVLITNPKLWSDTFLDGLDDGDWVQTTSAGYAAYPIETFAEEGVRFSNATNLHDTAVSEHVFALLFSFSRNLRDVLERQRANEWDRAVGDRMWDWNGKQLTVYGLGNIGEAVARRAKAFGMEVVGIKRNPAVYSGVLSDSHVVPPRERERVFRDTDALVLTLPLTDDTFHIVDSDALGTLPSTAILINVGRGPLVDSAALCRALGEGSLGGAGLDVVDPEPLPRESLLWGLDDVVISPHVGARTSEFASRFTRLFVYNLERWTGGEALANQIV